MEVTFSILIGIWTFDDWALGLTSELPNHLQAFSRIFSLNNLQASSTPLGILFNLLTQRPPAFSYSLLMLQCDHFMNYDRLTTWGNYVSTHHQIGPNLHAQSPIRRMPKYRSTGEKKWIVQSASH